MTTRRVAVLVAGFPTLLAAQTGRGPYARIAMLRPHDGQSVEFEAGYIRHLGWHQGAKDPWTWYGWSIWAGEHNRWFVYATFGHSAPSLDSAVAPAEDERDNALNVSPHVEWTGNAIYEFLPALSRGTGEPQPTSRLELTTVDLIAGGAPVFEAALTGAQSSLHAETLWYRLVGGGPAPRYVRLRPWPTLGMLLEHAREDPLPDAAARLVTRISVDILNFRPNMSLGIGLPAR